MFFDGPAGTQLPRRVIEAVSRAMTYGASNLGSMLALIAYPVLIEPTRFASKAAMSDS